MSAWERVLDNLRVRPSGSLGTRGRATRERQPGTLALREARSRAARARAGQTAASESATEPASSFRLESQESQGRGPGLPVGSFTDGRTVTIPEGITTNPGDPFQYEPDPYPTVLPSLSAEQLGQLAERRRLADERLKQAETEKDRRKGLLEASSLRAREDAERMSKRTLEDFMREAGGKGLARSPMVAGRAVRREGEDLRLKYGEIDTRLSTEVMALQDMVSRAASERDIAIAQIEQERVNMQADLDRLLPAAGMFR